MPLVRKRTRQAQQSLLTPDPVPVRIVGISTFGTADGFGPSTFTGMTLHAAQQHLSNKPNQLTAVLVKAAPGVSPSVLAARMRQVIPADLQAMTGTALRIPGRRVCLSAPVKLFLRTTPATTSWRR